MAHGKRAEIKANSKEYWGRRQSKYKYQNNGKKTKKNTHRLERLEGKKEIKKCLP